MISGIDISHYQSDDGVTPKRYFDPSIAKDKGIKFAFIKASENIYRDKAVDVFAQSFAEAGIPFGCYHFARPSAYGSNPAQQAQAFWNVIKDYKFSLPPVLDAEAQGVGLSYIKMFMETIEQLSGVTPILYTSPGFWTSLTGHQYAHWVEKYPLWIAQYFSAFYFPTYAIPDQVTNTTTMPRVPKPFDKWTFWQYAQTGDGEFYGGNYASWTNETGLDLNVYNGTQEEFEREFGLVESPEEPPQFISFRIKIKAQFLRYRTAPTRYAPPTMITERNEVFTVIGHEFSDGINWYKVNLPEKYGIGTGYISAEPGHTERI